MTNYNEFHVLSDVYKYLEGIDFSTEKLNELSKVSFSDAGEFKVLKMKTFYNFYKNGEFLLRLNPGSKSLSVGASVSNTLRYVISKDDLFIETYSSSRAHTKPHNCFVLKCPIDKDEYFNLTLTSNFKFSYEEMIEFSQMLEKMPFSIVIFDRNVIAEIEKRASE